MKGLDLALALANFAQVKQKLDDLFAKLDAVTPDALKDEEAEARALVEAAMASLDIGALQSSFAAAADVVKRGRGVSGGGFNAFLA